jgi:CheY-like chemotaxis protein
MGNHPILFVDDDLISRLLNCAILRECGFCVLEASTYAEACKLVEGCPKLGALVTDIDLGGEDDGFEIARRARAVDPDLPVVYISGTELARYAHEGVKESRFVPKPFDACQIARALEDLSPVAPMWMDGVPPAL